MQAPRPTYVTEAAFLDRDDDLRFAELLDGELIVSPAPGLPHQIVAADLFVQIHRWARAQRPELIVLFSPLDIRLAPGRILQPDVVVLPPEAREAGSPVRAVPLLCVEVLSPSRVGYDRHTKRLVYGLAGVPEYWVVDPAGGAERFSGPGLTHREACDAHLVSETLAGLEVTLPTG